MDSTALPAGMRLEDTWSRNEAARELGCDPRTVDRMASNGILAKFKIGSLDSPAASTKNGQDKRPVRFLKAEVAAVREARSRPQLVRQ